MHALTYRSHDGHAVDLYCERTWTPNLTEIRSTQWNYTLGTRGITGSSRPATETTITITTLNPNDLDQLQALADMDVESLSPGTLTINNEWTQKAFIVGTNVQSPAPSPALAIVTFRIVLCDGLWRHRLSTQRFTPMTADSGSMLDMPYDLPADLACPKTIQRISNPTASPCGFVCRIFGQATNPQFTVGGNLYRFDDVTVPSDGYMTVIGTSLEKSIKVTDGNGDVADRFCSGARGSGKGCGSYCFEPIPSGESILTWSGGFTIEFDLYESSGVPPWSTLS